VIDGSGAVGLTVSDGGGLSGMVGGDQASGGMTIAVSNAKSAGDLCGRFGDFTIGGAPKSGGALLSLGARAPTDRSGESR
jgi:hypothetical protein